MDEQQKPQIDPEALVRGKHIPVLVKSLVEQIGAHFGGAIARLTARVEALEAATPEYCGVHTVGHTYRRNQLCTFNGSLFICLKPTASSPPGPDWQCCVKRGRDGRDGRDRFEPPPQPPRLQ